MPGRLPDFFVVGTPRSGTTLVQRLACELPGVTVPPETHFFSDFVPELLGRRVFPLVGAALLEELQRYASRSYLRGVGLDSRAVADSLGGRCASVIELFGAVVGALAADAALVGEKTPGHLLWWEPLTSALPASVLVAVVRDPRAVAASYASLGWGGHPVLTARRWLDEAARVRAAAAALGPRCLVLRYEDVVADPDAARARLALALGAVAPGDAASGVGSPLFPAWETWKQPALGPIDPDRAEAWRRELSDRQAADIVAVCRSGMAWFEYEVESSARGDAARRWLFAPPLRARLVRAAWRRRKRDARIRTASARLTTSSNPEG